MGPSKFRRALQFSLRVRFAAEITAVGDNNRVNSFSRRIQVGDRPIRNPFVIPLNDVEAVYRDRGGVAPASGTAVTLIRWLRLLYTNVGTPTEPAYRRSLSQDEARRRRSLTRGDRRAFPLNQGLTVCLSDEASPSVVGKKRSEVNINYLLFKALDAGVRSRTMLRCWKAQWPRPASLPSMSKSDADGLCFGYPPGYRSLT